MQSPFESLEALRPDVKPLFRQLRKAPAERISRMRQAHPECPESYWQFLSERGSGPLEQDGTPFTFEEELLSAEKDVFGDGEIYSNGAKGDLLLFGHESMGVYYGFDTGKQWGLVEVDEFRIVTPMHLSFDEFVVGLVLCYPQIAIKVHGGEWFDATGNSYRLSPPMSAMDSVQG